MKKLLIAAALATTTLLFGCDDSTQSTIDRITAELTKNKNMQPFNVEFKNLTFHSYSSKNKNTGTLCGEIKLSRKHNELPKNSPTLIYFFEGNDAQQIIGDAEYSKFLYEAISDSIGENDFIKLEVLPAYNSELTNNWEIYCRR
ncbi:hypothetical protein MCL91_14520 [Providencia rettgeri]|uniref:hypothetical protein n=1 Tax=Providencia TaxID=586 RepID=UPI001EE707FA|nr:MULTISPECIES: hypothetical protein [Providencia]MCG5277788.1 hypothetical protein [Providencia rettgeri]MCG9508719.1 hypothetical protein [Providencia rettgeri]